VTYLFPSENLLAACDLANIQKIYLEGILFVLLGVCSMISNTNFILTIGVQT
jgi:hypothetical protein